jgi:hypothetical protein
MVMRQMSLANIVRVEHLTTAGSIPQVVLFLMSYNASERSLASSK